MEGVEVRRSPRARRWRLEVPWGEPARLTVPRWMSGAEAERILEEKLVGGANSRGVVDDRRSEVYLVSVQRGLLYSKGDRHVTI